MDYDAIVIGGGAAGLSAAVTLGRSRRSVLVVDGGQPRNAPAGGVHGFLGHDGISPHELLRRGRAEAASYGVEFRSGDVLQARRIDGGFDVDGATARKLVVATGLVDELPDLPGLAQRWGRDVVHCPYCHGWEVRDRQLVVLALGPLAAHQAMLFSQLSADVTLLLNGQPPIDEATAARLAARGVRIVDAVAAAVEIADDAIAGVRLEGGNVLPCQAIVVGAPVRARSGVLEQLGLATEPLLVNGHEIGSYVPADPAGRTALPGVYVAGNVTAPQQQVVHAAGSGVLAAAMVNSELIEEDAAAYVSA